MCWNWTLRCHEKLIELKDLWQVNFFDSVLRLQVMLSKTCIHVEFCILKTSQVLQTVYVLFKDPELKIKYQWWNVLFKLTTTNCSTHSLTLWSTHYFQHLPEYSMAAGCLECPGVNFVNVICMHFSYEFFDKAKT